MAVKEVVKEKYGQAALRVAAGKGNACCGSSPSSCCSGGYPITSNLYDQLQKDELPEAAVLASLGCGNPTALAELQPGRSCWASAAVAALMFCSRQSGYLREGKRTAET